MISQNGFIWSLQELMCRMSLGKEAGHVFGKERTYDTETKS